MTPSKFHFKSQRHKTTYKLSIIYLVVYNLVYPLPDFIPRLEPIVPILKDAFNLIFVVLYVHVFSWIYIQLKQQGFKKTGILTLVLMATVSLAILIDSPSLNHETEKLIKGPISFFFLVAVLSWCITIIFGMRRSEWSFGIMLKRYALSNLMLFGLALVLAVILSSLAPTFKTVPATIMGLAYLFLLSPHKSQDNQSDLTREVIDRI